MTTSVRYASQAHADPDRRCPTCTGPLPSTRARYCSVGCKQRAYRLRQVPVTPADLDALTADLRRRRALVAHTIYECPACNARFLGEQRCAECNRFCRALGPGGACPGCDEPLRRGNGWMDTFHRKERNGRNTSRSPDLPDGESQRDKSMSGKRAAPEDVYGVQAPARPARYGES